MPRLPRLNLANIPQHVIQRGNNRNACFLLDRDRQYYLNKLQEYSQKFNVKIHAYVLMNNHVHLLLSPEEKFSVSLLMQSLGRSYVRYFNKSYKRSGTLWEGRFKSSLIDSENYFLIVSRYIELNPVRANMVEKPESYDWSSYRTNALGYFDELITHHQCFMMLGKTNLERQKNYQSLFENTIPLKVLTELRISAHKSQALGNKKFIDELENLLGRKVISDSHGGDRKSSVYKQMNQGF
ncbi:MULTISPECIES: transposase [Colwellia]|uniref:Transposase n=1 Tax=Colwellia marinimaniae TaxID=1513592 RepID=A0ABQ0MZA4_9GAMM|nr:MULTISPECIES: transposase [Colwellia]GAW97699.1 transposase [Colwellia marinimaniae]